MIFLMCLNFTKGESQKKFKHIYLDYLISTFKKFLMINKISNSRIRYEFFGVLKSY
jgi:hypothetical protein